MGFLTVISELLFIQDEKSEMLGTCFCALVRGYGFVSDLEQSVIPVTGLGCK